jgi:CBF1 interacting corepressor
MGKGFENYMSKKWFHPTNIDNMKRVYAARQKESDFVQRQADLKEQYIREQEVFGNKQLMGDEKARLGLSFMYNAPASLADQEQKKKDGKKCDDEEEYSQNGTDLTGQSSKVRKMRCVKCKKWGHANTDKICPLYGKSKLDVDFLLVEEDEKNEEKLELMNDEPSTSKSKLSIEDQRVEISLEMLYTLPKEEKRALLKRLNKLMRQSKWRRKAKIV